ncbi:MULTISPECIES: SRPBCC family protein [Streptomyces]|uniref:SRPBCC family protein n=1 Tax=Streptomyces chengmaiensis TaxID=3040919 RepID=A0ABT6HNG1_9ACTN|nr:MULTISPECIES: SRPBCC family protein [Streptomyces]MDH2389837.1 SRPBCC family protein [Streptomyces chengmaiensis]WRQ79747.1 SRPBCC family protein [Streptomyces sp. MUM 178J]
MAAGDTTVHVERRIAAPAGRVWRALTDLESMPRVLSGVERVEILSEGRHGSFDVGTRWRETRRMMGKLATEEMYVTAVEPERRYVVEADSHGAHYVSEFALRGDGPQATTVRMTFSATPPSGIGGVVAKLLGGLGRRAVSKAIAKDLEDVARSVESEPSA